MTRVFADTSYWIALISPRDEWHAAAIAIGPRLRTCEIVTTDEVLIEVLAFFSKYGPQWRGFVVKLVESLNSDHRVTVRPQSRDSFIAGFELYKQRLDKEYSLTDCISMETMLTAGLSEVLTYDRHFEQEGFSLLLTAGSS